jgi:hypothetical protein
MIHKARFMIAGVAICILCYGPIIYFAKKDSEQCDEIVFLEGSTSMDVRDVDSYENGMSHIELCDGTTMTVPTSRIIKVVEKENVQ